MASSRARTPRAALRLRYQFLRSVLVVGGGIMGLASAWALRRRGFGVTLVEQGEIPNPLGSSVDQHRLIRYPYGAEPGYTRMVGEAYAGWERLFSDIGERPYQATGSLVVSTGDASWARASADCLTALGHPLSWLSSGELARRFPLIDASGVTAAFFTDSGGVLLASRIVDRLRRHLEERGVRVLTRSAARSLDLDAARLTLADGSSLAGDALLVTAGAWVTRLVPELRGRVTPSRQVVVYLDPPEDLLPLWSNAPLVLDIDQQAGFYLVPPVLGLGLKVGDHRFTLRGDPDREREASDAEARQAAELCRARLRGFDRYRVASARTCFYTVEPRERFVVLGHGRGLVVSACSGHAFKFGSVVGERVAETIDGGRDLASLARWAAGGG
jgi:glycine/D-amino acid oxidase-like deaminating enzyme